MKPKLYGRSFVITVPGFPQPTECLFPRFQAPPRNSRDAGTAENNSPYPGINIGSGVNCWIFDLRKRKFSKKGRTKYALGQDPGGLTTSDQFAEFLTLSG